MSKLMSPSTSFSSFPLLFQDVHYSRKLLLHTPFYQSPKDTAIPPSQEYHWPSSEQPYTLQSSFDANVVMILSVLLCALICALGLNSIIRCALRCPSQVSFESGNNTSNREANTGVKKKALKMFPVVVYSAELKLPGLDTECVICLSEFAQGERVRVLPNCHHGFHTRCIDKWLLEHSSCPTCRHCPIDTCQKIVGCSQTSSPAAPPPPPPPEVAIVPLEREGFISSYESSS